MAGIKISALPAVPAAQLTDIFPVVQGGVTFKETVQQLETLISTSLTGTFVRITGDTMSGPLILSGDPVLPLGAATKEYVDTIAAGFTVVLACLCATTGNLNAVYANGAGGVGATLTDNSGTFVAFSTDGVSPALTDRILVKNQTNSFENGIYVLTTNGDGMAIPWVLTRSTDYDQAPAEIKPGTLIAVNTGTVNATTSWLETATVAAVGIDPILFSQFTFGPTSFLLKANNLSDLTNVAAALANLGLGIPTGTGNVVRQTSPTLITPLLGNATASSLTFAPTTSGIVGTTTNNNAAAGIVGEYISSIIGIGAAVPLVNNVSKTVTSISLTAGDWDVWAELWPNGGAGATLGIFSGSINNVNNTLSGSPADATCRIQDIGQFVVGVTGLPIVELGVARISINGPTTIYLVAYSIFSGGTMGAYGKICARRVR